MILKIPKDVYKTSDLSYFINIINFISVSIHHL